VNTITKILYWFFTIVLGFVNPLISIVMVVLYYLPQIFSDSTQSREEIRENYEMKSFSDDVLEDMK